MKKQTGYLRIVCRKKGEKTILQDAYFEGALKITRPLYLDQSGEAYLYMMNPGGGYLDGDSYKIEVNVEEDAAVVLTTQSSTKIYKTIEIPSLQEVEIHLRKGSCFEYLPDPVIAFLHAQFKQKTVVHMERGASLICKDIFTPGWAPDGTLFQYDLIQSSLDIFQEDQISLFDHLKLEPDEDTTEIGRMEGYSHYGTMIVINEQVNRVLLDNLKELCYSFPEARIGMTLLSVPGFSLRILANSTQTIENIISCCHEHIRLVLFKKKAVSLRKY